MEITEQTYTIEDLDKLAKDQFIEILDSSSVSRDTYRLLNIDKIKPTMTDTGLRFDYFGIDLQDRHKVQFSSWGVRTKLKPSEILLSDKMVKLSNNGSKFLSLE